MGDSPAAGRGGRPIYCCGSEWLRIGEAVLISHRCGVRGRCVAERLEGRRLLSAVGPTAIEQYVLQQINRARANPAAEAASLGIDLNEGLSPGTVSAEA